MWIKIRFSSEKSVSLNGENLEEVEYFRYLGVDREAIGTMGA